MVMSPQHADVCAALVHSTLAGHESHDGSQRIWWRVPGIKAEVDFPEKREEVVYVSLNPGEYRSTAPSEANAIIRDAPPPLDHIPPTRLLRRAIGGLRVAQTLPELLELTERIEGLTRPGATSAALRDFWADFDKALGNRQNVDIEKIELDLFSRYYFDHRLPGEYFNPAMAYISIAARAGALFEAEAFVSPRTALRMYLQWMPKEHDGIIESAVNVANMHYREGRRRMRSAIDALTRRRFVDDLFFAAHHFDTARFVATIVEEHASFEFRPYVAEEGWAGVQPGLHHALENDTIDDAALLEDRLVEMLTEGEPAEARQYADRLSSTTNPLYPRFWTHLATARALTRAREAEEGLRRLLVLERTFTEHAASNDYDSAEYFRLMTGISYAYNRTGDEESAQRYAARLFGRVLVQQASTVSRPRR